MVDTEILAAYLKALEALKTAEAAGDKEEAYKCEYRAASHWFVMNGATMKAALAEARARNLPV